MVVSYVRCMFDSNGLHFGVASADDIVPSGQADTYHHISPVGHCPAKAPIFESASITLWSSSRMTSCANAIYDVHLFVTGGSYRSRTATVISIVQLPYIEVYIPLQGQGQDIHVHRLCRIATCLKVTIKNKAKARVLWQDQVEVQKTLTRVRFDHPPKSRHRSLDR